MVEHVICSPEILDVGRVLDQEFNVWELGYQRFYRRRKIVKFVDRYNLTFTDQAITSESFFCDPYTDLTLLLKDVANNSQSSVKVTPWISHNNVDFYKLSRNNQIEGDWISTDSTDRLQATQGTVYYPYVRFVLEQLSVQAGRENLVSLDVAFSG